MDYSKLNENFFFEEFQILSDKALIINHYQLMITQSN